VSAERQGLGRQGERLAERHLAELGYRVLERNWRYGSAGEIDLVALDGTCLVLVEVRTRRGHSFGTPEDSITPNKQARLVELAYAYQVEKDWHGPMRIDVVGVHLSADGRLLAINHLQDAVGA
jgi:putative endonuclease